jgi:CheY-like chemotaxis protein
MAAGNKILIVDEQAETCCLLSEYVGHEGLTAVLAHSGEAGLEKIRTAAIRWMPP